MQTNAELKNNSKLHFSTISKSLQKKQNNTKSRKIPNVRTTDYKSMEKIFLTDPDSVTQEEFLLFQKAAGYRRAMQLLNEGKRRKQLRKVDGTAKTARNLQQNNDQYKTDTKQQGVIQKQNIFQTTKKSENEPIQKKSAINTGKSLPGNLKSGLEKLSGIDLSDVSVHRNSDKPQQVGALAYTQGNKIHIAPEQEKHLPHEGWHAVQQKQGRVVPTMQMKTGTLVNDNVGLEKEADIMGSKAMTVGSQTDTKQLKNSNNLQQESKVIQRITVAKDKMPLQARQGTKQSPRGQISIGPTTMEAAEMADKCYTAKKGDMVGEWKVVEDVTTNDEGLRLVVYGKLGLDKKMEYVIANAGTTFTSIDDWKNNIQQPFGNSKDMEDSLKKVKDFVNKHPKANITFVGHSKGGAEAAINAVATNKNCIIFNPATSNLRTYVPEENINNYSARMIAYIVKGEILNNIFGPMSKPIDIKIELPMQHKVSMLQSELFNFPNSIKNHLMDAVKDAIIEAGYQNYK